MKVLLLGVTSALLASILSGCGGGSGGGTTTPAPPTPPPGPTTTTTTTPGPPAPPPSPAPCTGDCRDIKVLSYNLEWHTNGVHLDRIAKTINANGQFDLLGMQECENIGALIGLVGTGKSYGTYQVTPAAGIKPGKPNQGDICMAWNTAVFDKISQGQAPVGTDGWATRMMQWVYLNIKGTNRNVMFANTHGPVGQCIGKYEAWSAVADAYLKNSKGNMKPGDHLFFTGDFNCGGTPLAKKDPSGHGMDDIIIKMRKELTDTAQASFFYPALFQPDRIWTLKDSDIQTVDWAAVCCGGPGDCQPTKMFYDQPDAAQPRCVAVPSDHMLLRGHYKVPVGATLLNSTNKVVV